MPNPGLASGVASPAAVAQAVPLMVDATPLSAADRLAASRTRLRAALMEITHPPPRPSMFDGLGKLGGFLDLKGPLIDRIKAMPGASLVLETLESWWAQHPLHTAGVVAEEASRNFVLPIARQNPYGLMIGSVVFGALFVLSRPWRWLLRPALFVGLVPQLAVQALKRMPIESWLRVFESIKTPRKPAATTDAPSATDDRPEAPSIP